jgi:hypothetical protein
MSIPVKLKKKDEHSKQELNPIKSLCVIGGQFLLMEQFICGKIIVSLLPATGQKKSTVLCDENH